MEDFMTRLLLERQELESKVEKLGAFNSSSAFDKLSLSHRMLLETQYRAMGEYLSILYVRIDLLNAEGAKPTKATKAKIKRKK